MTPGRPDPQRPPGWLLRYSPCGISGRTAAPGASQASSGRPFTALARARNLSSAESFGASSRTHRPQQRSRRTPIMDPIRRKILKTGAAATAMAAAPRVFAQQTGQGGAASLLRKRPRSHPLSGVRFRLPVVAHRRRGIELDDLRLERAPLTRSRSSRASTAASRRTCATPMAASPPARSRSTGRGMHIPMTISV